MPVFNSIAAQISGFKYPLTLQIPSLAKTAVFGPKSTDLIDVIANNKYDAKRISYPDFGMHLWPSQAIQFVNFSTGLSSKAPFISARFESFRDEFDHNVLSLLEKAGTQPDIDRVISQFNLHDLLDKWSVGLSNGQNRRTQLAMALLKRPKLLIIDEPFLGLDPANLANLSSIIEKLEIPVVMKFRDFENFPDFITQTIYAGESGLCFGQEAMTMKQHILRHQNPMKPALNTPDYTKPIVELQNLTIYMKNATNPLLNNVNLKVHAGEKVRIMGPNGSGKSTLLACISAEHPQSWTENIRLLDEPRQVGKHTFFQIQDLIGSTSPEIHAIFNPETLVSKIIVGPDAPEILQALDLSGLANMKFKNLSIDQQKLVLFGKALAKRPKILILDEAFSGMNASQIEKCFELVSRFDGAALIIGHAESEIPNCHQVLQLGEPNKTS